MIFEIKKSEGSFASTIIIDGVEVKDSFFSPIGTIEISDVEISQKVISLSFDEIILSFRTFGFLENLYLSPLVQLKSKVNINARFKYNT